MSYRILKITVIIPLPVGEVTKVIYPDDQADDIADYRAKVKEEYKADRVFLSYEEIPMAFNLFKMKAKRVIYSRLISKGNYENAKIEIELEVEENESAGYVFQCAKEWVENRIAVEKISDYKVEQAKRVMEDKRNHTLAQIEEAEEVLSKSKNIQDDGLPF